MPRQSTELEPLYPGSSPEYDLRANLGRLLTVAQRLTAAFQGDPLGSEQLTVSTSVRKLTVPDDALSATVQCLDQPLRFTLDGSAPTATTGFRLGIGDSAVITGRVALQRFQVIREGATDGTLVVQYFD